MLLCVVAGAATSCKEERKLNVASKIKAAKMPTMQTRNIATFISDSGVVQYKIVAPIWQVWEQGENPHWSFPEGIYLQKYNRQRQVIATIAADSATFFKNKKLWRLDGNVEIRKKPKDLFLTQQLFWDQNRRLLYNDTFTHVETATHMLEGQGFRANEQFTEYRVIKPTGIFPTEQHSDAQRGALPPGIPAGTPIIP